MVQSLTRSSRMREDIAAAIISFLRTVNVTRIYTHTLGCGRRAARERQQRESQLRHQQKLEAIGTLASGVAHEINNPLNGIMNYAQLIVDRLDRNDPLHEYAVEIIRETERVADIVRALLTFARQDHQHHSAAYMVDIVNATLALVRTVFRHDQIHLHVDAADDLPPITCRSQHMQQVIMNLLTNARDALNVRYPGSHPDKTILITIRVVTVNGQRWLRTLVEDHGIGIPAEIRARIFDPFFTTKPKDAGTSLGLSVSHGIVLEHHGVLSVDSELGRYTRFCIDLPLGG